MLMCIEELENNEGLCLEEKIKIYEKFLESPCIKHFSELNSLPVLTGEEEVELAKKRDEGEDGKKIYKNSFFAGNLRLVRKWSGRYYSPTIKYHDLTQEDLIQEGAIGLLKAIEYFDHTKDSKFSTYATFWIEQSITRAIMDKGNNIRLPVNQHVKLRKFKYLYSKFSLELGHPPKVKEISDILNIEQEKAANLMMSFGYETTSLDEEIVRYGDGYHPLVDYVEDENALSPEEEAIKSVSLEEMRKIIDKFLKGRQREVIIMRYGFEDGSPRTLESIGKQFGVTRERIRKIENEAFKKLRALINSKNRN